jgi:hypothetical protein
MAQASGVVSASQHQQFGQPQHAGLLYIVPKTYSISDPDSYIVTDECRILAKTKLSTVWI